MGLGCHPTSAVPVPASIHLETLPEAPCGRQSQFVTVVVTVVIPFGKEFLKMPLTP